MVTMVLRYQGPVKRNIDDPFDFDKEGCFQHQGTNSFTCTIAKLF